jgi:hypothetical protein
MRGQAWQGRALSFENLDFRQPLTSTLHSQDRGFYRRARKPETLHVALGRPLSLRALRPARLCALSTRQLTAIPKHVMPYMSVPGGKKCGSIDGLTRTQKLAYQNQKMSIYGEWET